MDVQFEDRLLALVDGFLEHTPEDFASFRAFQEALGTYYFEQSHKVTWPIERNLEHLSLSDLIKTKEFAEIERIAESQLPRERRATFERVSELASFTVHEGHESDRHYGLITLTEFVSKVRALREQYRYQFGR